MKTVIIAVLVSVSFFAGNFGAITNEWEFEKSIFNSSWNQNQPELSSRFGEDSCSTPNGLNGECIPINQCKPLFSMLMRHRINKLSTADQIFLQRCQCGWDRRGPLVCCSHESTSGRSGAPRGGLSELDLPRPGICGAQLSDEVFAGETTQLTEHPWFALIEYSKPNERKKEYRCGGSLINNNYVLTAAHCIKDGRSRSGSKTTGVRLGEHDITTNPDCDDEDHEADPVLDVAVAEIIVHEKFSMRESNENDIALLRLIHSVQSTDYIRPICLPFSRNVRNKEFDGTELTLTGFGQTEKEWKSDVKLKVKVNGSNFNHCNRIFTSNGLPALTKSHLCAGGEEGKGSCNGDSGGPLVGEDKSDDNNPYIYLAGIVSFSIAGCGKSIPTVYTRVDQYLNWILEHMRH